MSIFKTKLNHFNIRLDNNRTEKLKANLQKETIKIHTYTYTIKQIENSDCVCKYQLLPIALSSGFANCFTPIIWIEVTELDEMFNVVVTLRTYTAVGIMLAVHCALALLIETAMLTYLVYCMIVYRSMPTIEVLKYLFSAPVIIPVIMFIICCITFRNIRDGLLDEMNGLY